MLGGIALGHLVGPPLREGDLPHPWRHPAGRAPGWLPVTWPGLVLYGAMGALPDLDFALGMHSRQSHSIGAVAVVFLAVLWLSRGRSGTTRLAAAAAVAYGSHILLDWLGSDTSHPIGIMALWPITDAFYQSDLHWFPAIWRDYRPGIWAHDLWAVVWEMTVLGPVAAAAAWWGRGRNDHGRTME